MITKNTSPKIEGKTELVVNSLVEVKTIKGEKKPAWEVVLNVLNPGNNRPRRMSLHTLAYLTRTEDIMALAKEQRLIDEQFIEIKKLKEKMKESRGERLPLEASFDKRYIFRKKQLLRRTNFVLCSCFFF